MELYRPSGENPAAALFGGPRCLHLSTEFLTGILQSLDRLPRPLSNGLVGVGALMVMLALPKPRRNAHDYLTALLGRPPSVRELWRHYREFTAMYSQRVRVALGRPHHWQSECCEDFTTLMRSNRPALLGTFHFGNSDLLGFVLGQFQRHVFMVRYRLGNPRFLHRLAAQMGAGVTMIWVDEGKEILFGLKKALERGGTVVMKCDNVGDAAKLEAFEFLGTRRWFPFTIYRLGILFQRPVTFCVSLSTGPDRSIVIGFPVFEPGPGTKAENLERARAHFQSVLAKIEELLHANPHLWHSFRPLNPEAKRLTPAQSHPVSSGGRRSPGWSTASRRDRAADTREPLYADSGL